MNFLTCILNLTIVSQDEPHSLIASLCLGLPSHRILSVSGVCVSPIGRLDPCSSDVIIWKKKKQDWYWVRVFTLRLTLLVCSGILQCRPLICRHLCMLVLLGIRLQLYLLGVY